MRFIVCLVVILALIAAATAIDAILAPPAFTLNLDLPPERRWDGAVKTIVDANGGWDATFGPIIALYAPITFFVPQFAKQAFYANLEANHAELLGELRGIYAQMNHYGNISKIVDFQSYASLVYGYEIQHYRLFAEKSSDEKKEKETMKKKGSASFPHFFTRQCTGILSLPQDPTMSIMHFRNMDESPTQAGAKVTLHITAVSNGKTAFEAIDWLWMTSGVETSMRSSSSSGSDDGGLSLELNYETQNNQSHALGWHEMAALANATTPVLLLHRVAHKQRMNLKQFTAAMQNQGPHALRFMAPFFTVASGGRVGSVFTVRGIESTDVVVQTIDGSVAGQVKRSGPRETDEVPNVLMVTNYWNWLPDPPSDPRRTAAAAALRMMGEWRASTEMGCWMALSTYPVHNAHTMYSAVMITSRPHLEGYLRMRMHPAEF